MPTYDYECRNCSGSFEFFQSMKESPKTTCPTCGQETLHRLIGAGAGFLFKGSGFYITDYRSADYKAKAKADGGGSDSGSGSSKTKEASSSSSSPASASSSKASSSSSSSPSSSSPSSS